MKIYSFYSLYQIRKYWFLKISILSNYISSGVPALAGDVPQIFIMESLSEFTKSKNKTLYHFTGLDLNRRKNTYIHIKTKIIGVFFNQIVRFCGPLKFGAPLLVLRTTKSTPLYIPMLPQLVRLSVCMCGCIH